MSPTRTPPPCLVTVEARNALRAETFRRLPEALPLWRFREVLTQLGAELGLSGGATVYALDLMGLLTEADWRGDGRPVTFHSLRAYAARVGRSERTLCNWERQLIAAGLVHRTARHARRHGGGGDERRRTGLDWRSFGVLLPELLARLDARRAADARRRDLETRIRAERRLLLDLAAGEGGASALRARLAEMGVMPLRGGTDAPDLERRLAALTLMRAQAVEASAAVQPEPSVPVDNPPACAQATDLSENPCPRIEITLHSSCPTDIRRRAGKESAGNTGRSDDGIGLERLWQAAPARWRTMLGSDVPLSWPVLVEIADHRARELDVAPRTWMQAVRSLGASEATLALLVLDRNRDHPARPVRNVGAALAGMLRRAGQGELNLAASLHGIVARAERQGYLRPACQFRPQP